MAQSLIHRVVADARPIIGDRRRRLRCSEAVTAQRRRLRCLRDPAASRFCAVGALINAAYRITGDHEQAHRFGWKVAGMIAVAAGLRLADAEDAAGWRLAMLSDTRGAELRLSTAWTRYRGPLKKNGINVSKEVLAFRSRTRSPHQSRTGADLRSRRLRDEVIDGGCVQASVQLRCRSDAHRAIRR